ncbi:serine/threonine-protein kinase LATS2-like [Diceros bicornis minor]|uniref:serine/threonine-protein kinase LATS2-like n=1 Tax=Diceros bicornis minor TaxID=77932 RepID=UPI0026EDF522|nr:serine/threonine-protein kinase LATS2-like [Diceros bicornis minor]
MRAWGRAGDREGRKDRVQSLPNSRRAAPKGRCAPPSSFGESLECSNSETPQWRLRRRLLKPRSEERVKALKGEQSSWGSGRRLVFPALPQSDPRVLNLPVPGQACQPQASDWPSPRVLPAPALPPLVKTAGAGQGAATGGSGASGGDCSSGGPEPRPGAAPHPAFRLPGFCPLGEQLSGAEALEKNGKKGAKDSQTSPNPTRKGGGG